MEDDVLTVEESFSQSTIYQCGCIGGIIGSITVFVIFCHSLYVFDRRNRSGQKDGLEKSAYVMSFIYFISSITVCSIYAFIRSNLIYVILTDEISTFSLFRCEFGYFGGFVLLSINKILLFVLFLCRIESSIVKSRINLTSFIRDRFVVFYVALCLFAAVGCVLFVMSQKYASWTLVTHERAMFCNRSRFEHDYALTFVGHSLFAFGELILYSLLLFMLYSMLDRLSKYYRIASLSIDEKQHCKRLLHSLRKLTILLVLTCCATVMFFVLILWNFSTSVWVAWDVLLKSINVWLLTDNLSFCFCCCCRRLRNECNTFVSVDGVDRSHSTWQPIKAPAPAHRRRHTTQSVVTNIDIVHGHRAHVHVPATSAPLTNISALSLPRPTVSYIPTVSMTGSMPDIYASANQTKKKRSSSQTCLRRCFHETGQYEDDPIVHHLSVPNVSQHFPYFNQFNVPQAIHTQLDQHIFYQRPPNFEDDEDDDDNEDILD